MSTHLQGTPHLNSSALATPVGGHSRRLRRALPWIAIVLALLLIGLIANWIQGTRSPFDPGSRQGLGTRAVASVLRDKGITVTIVHDAAAVRAASDPHHSTLVLLNPGGAGSDPPAISPADFAQYSRVVLVGYSELQLAHMGLGAVQTSFAGNPSSLTRCADPELGQARGITPAQIGYLPTTGFTGCFSSPPTTQVLSRAASPGAPRIDLVANQRIFTNDGILRADNAAFALRVLGRDPQLVWFVQPTSWFTSTPSGPSVWTGGLDQLFPQWTAPLINLLLASGFVAMVWRGRRLGPLVVEPLPVEVKALETTTSRGQLYRSSGDAAHALGVLQQATRRRLATRVGLPPRAPIEQLALAIARKTGDQPDNIVYLLTALPPATDPRGQHDADLVRIAGALSELEQRITL